MTSPLVLLDLDGTLTDSGPGITSSVASAYAALGLPVPDAATLRSFVGPTINESFALHGIPEDRIDNAIVAYRDVYKVTGMWDNKVYDGIPEQLRALREAGCLLAVATKKPEHFAVPICERFGLTDLVDGVFGTPLDEQTTKAEVIAKAIATLGWIPGTAPALMVGDRLHDVEGARVHGIDCLGVSWGYAAEGELERAGAVEVLDDVDSLAGRVLALLAR